MFEWQPRPDGAKVVDVIREPTSEGEPCQVHAVIEFTKDGKAVGRRKLTINPGLLDQYDFEKSEESFTALWNRIPEAVQTVKDAVRAQIPDEMLRDLWQGRKG